jgi:hypothetical protein
MLIWIRNTTFFHTNFRILRFTDWDTKEIFRFVICGLIIKKFADLPFADWHTSEICGYGIAERAQEFSDLRFADKQKN